MKTRTYLVAYKSEEGKNKEKVKEALSLVGKVEGWEESPASFVAFFTPNEEEDDAVSLRGKMSECINPFEEGVAAIAVDVLDSADTDKCQMPIAHSRPSRPHENTKQEAQQCTRNFERFKTRHEAFVAWNVEKPIWMYPDNIGNAILMSMEEWLWMPMKKDGRYERGKYEKYLG